LGKKNYDTNKKIETLLNLKIHEKKRQTPPPPHTHTPQKQKSIMDFDRTINIIFFISAAFFVSVSLE
jgi:hypothetical protein